MKSSPRKLRFRFSLRWLIVCAAFLAVLLSHIKASLDLQQSHATLERQESELKKLRAELGIFDVSDPTKAHVLFVPQQEDQNKTWRWRIYLPPGRNYKIRWVMDGIPSEGLETEWEGQDFQVFRDRGLFTLDAFVRKGADGHWHCFVRHPSGELRRELPDDHPLVEPQEPVVLESYRVGTNRVVTADMQQPLVVFRHRIIPKTEFDAAQQLGKTPTKPYPGIMIWFEAAK